MLDTNTKRRIDTARDILVGKVPDPKSQVEQITIALIYKFMDDMDAESEELGGKRTFFANGFSRYSWAKLMRSGLGGHETLNLYAEAITRMPENPAIPVLFRSIFKNAYLPYRDPETLKSFLKVIDEFEYDHSERLGDAFEYLLSVLGSQGDAGQFRTPRHIIDFMVKIIDPKKHEKILDPACGTAGFLISSFKHIREANKETPLTPDEMGTLAANIKGYDISPDMVRLSLVNMYLHGFNDPHIEEYDTLTSQDKWNEHADVILANPPFMSPKGGIKPHKRFSVQSKRSEVLFVDYMHEHLTPHGRAAIIVPEGIIFQSGTAYKQLRKMLVENSLVAVVSLPAGVFQPYSGVKTSILILDKSLAKQSQHIGFFKVENDGFGLGAQRRPIEKNDLPMVNEEVEKFLQALRNRDDFEALGLSTGLAVLRAKVAKNGEHNLSGERYKKQTRQTSCFDMVPIGEVCKLIGGATPSKQEKKYWTHGTVKWISSKHIGINGQITSNELISEVALQETSTGIAPKGSTIIITRVSVGKFAFATDDYAINQDLTALVSKDDRILTPQFIKHIARHIAEEVEKNAAGIGVRGVTRTYLSELEIPLPPIEVQQEIVAEIEGYQKVIDGARSVIGNYKPQIPVDPEWEMVELGDVVTLQRGYDLPKRLWVDGPYPIVGSNGIIGFHADYKENGPGVVTGRSGTIGKVHFIEYNHYWPHNTSLFVKDFKNNDPRFVKVLLESIDLKSLGERTAAVPSLDRKNAHRIRVQIPPFETQQAIVAEIEAEQALVNANRELIERFEKKIRAAIARVWGTNESSTAER